MWLCPVGFRAEVEKAMSMELMWLSRTHQTRRIHRKRGGTQNLSEIDIPMVGHRQISDSDQHGMCLALANKSGFTLRARRRLKRVHSCGSPACPTIIITVDRGFCSRRACRNINGTPEIQSTYIQHCLWRTRYVRYVV